VTKGGDLAPSAPPRAPEPANLEQLQGLERKSGDVLESWQLRILRSQRLYVELAKGMRRDETEVP